MALGWLFTFLAEDRDEAIIGWLWKVLIVVIAIASLIKVPYGKNSMGTGKAGAGKTDGLLSRLIMAQVTVPARLGWFVMELPALAVPLFLLLAVGGRHANAINPNMTLLGLFILHYFNRYRDLRVW